MLIENFTNDHYQRHNKRRQEHLATLGLPIAGKTVLEVGAGIGEHTSFFLDRGCAVTSTEGRPELARVIQKRHPSATVHVFDSNGPIPAALQPHEIVYAYGVLYHLGSPERALRSYSELCMDLLLLESCVSFGRHEAINPVDETADDPTQALDGLGCRPTRPWIWARLKECFEHVYATATQPWHEEFPVDWSDAAQSARGLTRAIFVASRRPLNLPGLLNRLPERQAR